MNCYKCEYSDILKKPINCGEYSIYGYCRKNGGRYNIYLPEGRCMDFKAREIKGLEVEE